MGHRRSLGKKYVWLIAIVFLIPFLFIAFYAEPIADDYAYAYRLQIRPFWEAYSHEYFSWNGRFISNLLVLLNPYLIAYRWLYHLSGLAVIISLVLSTCFLLKPFFKKNRAFAISSVTVVIYLGSSARISETIYWYTGTMTYTTGTILTVLAIGCLIRFTRSPKLIWGILAGLCMVLSIGTNEVSMAVNLLLAGAYAYKYKRGRWAIVLVAAIAAFLVFQAPGNEVRGQFFQNTHKVLYSTGMSILQTLRFTALSLAYLPLPLAAIYIWGRMDVESLNCNLIKFFEKWPTVLILAAIFTPLFLSAFIPYYSTGILGQHRTISFGQYYLTVGVLALPIIVFVKRPSVFSWVRRGVSRETQIIQAKRDTLLQFSPLDTTVLFVIDIDKNPNHWINAHQCSVLNPELNVRIERSPR